MTPVPTKNNAVAAPTKKTTTVKTSKVAKKLRFRKDPPLVKLPTKLLVQIQMTLRCPCADCGKHGLKVGQCAKTQARLLEEENQRRQQQEAEKDFQEGEDHQEDLEQQNINISNWWKIKGEKVN